MSNITTIAIRAVLITAAAIVAVNCPVYSVVSLITTN